MAMVNFERVHGDLTCIKHYKTCINIYNLQFRPTAAADQVERPPGAE